MQDLLQTVFEHFSDREKKAFERYLNVDRKLDKRKDQGLMDAMDSTLKPEFKSKKERDAYHQNRRRLTLKLSEFLWVRSMRSWSSSEAQSRRHFILAQYLFEQNEVDLAWKNLQKAERVAREEEDVESLQEVYRLMVERIGQAPKSLEHKELLKKKLKADKLAIYEENLRLASAVIKHQLAEAKESGKARDLSQYLDGLLRRLELNEVVSESPKYAAYILRFTRDALLTQRDLSQFEWIAKDIHQRVDWSSKLDSTPIARSVLDMQYMIAHAAYRNKNYESAEAHLGEMYDLMQKHERTLLKQWEPSYVSLLGMIQALTRRVDVAIQGHEEFIEANRERLPQERLLNMELNLAWFYICAGRHKDAHKILYHTTDSMNRITKLMGREWVMRRGLIYGLNHYELGNDDVAIKTLKGLTKDYAELLSAPVYQKASIFIELSIRYMTDYHKFTRSEFVEKIQADTSQIDISNEENKSLGFFAWLLSKVNGKSYYDTVLELVN